MVFGKPQVCALCGTVLTTEKDRERGICHLCHVELTNQMACVCQICGIPIKPPLVICNTCRKNLYYFDAQRSCGVYKDSLRYAVIRFKHWGERWLAKPLGGLMAEKAKEFQRIDLAVPCPVDSSRRLDRGFNQAQDLSLVVSSILKVKHMDVLARRASAPHQKGLGRNRRWENLRGIMRAKRPVDLGGAHVLVVDDVVTTGATLDECARVLKGLGAERVYGISCARTIDW